MPPSQALVPRRTVAWVCATLGFAAAFGALAAYNLANYRPVTNDEVELIAVAYKLATQRVLGSDLYAGFFGADQHFFITLPLQHVLEAIAFWLAGPGVAQARGVSVVAGVAVVWLVGWLTFRWYGLAAALLCEALLVAWPSNLTAASNGLPLLGVSRTARYDVLAVAAAWLAIVLLDTTLRRPRAAYGLGLGVCCGIAALSQFMGAFVLPLVVVNWLWARGRASVLGWILVGTALALLPWAALAALHPSDVAGQLTVYAGRGDFLRPGFYVENLTQEADRYAHLLRAGGPSTWLLTLGTWPALAYVAWHSRRARLPGDRIVWSTLVVFSGLLLLLDHSKSSVYAIVLVPPLCLALSRLVTGALQWLWQTYPHRWVRGPTSAIAIGLLLGVGNDGLSAAQLTLTQAQQVSPYDGVGQQIKRALLPGGRVLGPERWWWAVHTHPYHSLRSLWWQWANDAAPTFVDGVAWFDADNVIVNDNVRDDVIHFGSTIEQRFWTYLHTCTTRVASIDDPTYFGIDIYRVIKPAPDPAICTGRRTR